MKLSKATLLSFVFGAAILLVGFQNCADQGFSMATPTVIDAACDVASGCASAASTTPPQQQQQPVQQSMPYVPPSSYPTNFVAGDRATCEASILSRLGKPGTCSIGGGCGISCGMPGGNCASANPSLWGACIDPSAIVTQPAPAQSLYNFVAGDKATCEATIMAHIGKSVSCSIGAGCGLACGMPGANCPSANPTHWGACILH